MKRMIGMKSFYQA